MREIAYNPNPKWGYFNPRELVKDLLITGSAAVAYDFFGNLKIDNIVPNLANGAGTLGGFYFEGSADVEHRKRSSYRALAFGAVSLIGRVLFCDHDNWREYPLDAYFTIVRFMLGSLPSVFLSTAVPETDLYDVYVKTDSVTEVGPKEPVKVEYPIKKGRIELVNRQRITRYGADALVCPANRDLDIEFPFGNLQSVFVEDCGKELGKSLKALMDSQKTESGEFGIPWSSAHLTDAPGLEAKHIIHSVSDKNQSYPVSKPEDSKQRVSNVLALARREGVKSVGFAPLGIHRKYADRSGLREILGSVTGGMIPGFSEHLDGKKPVERIGLVFDVSDETFGMVKDMVEQELYVGPSGE